MNFKAHKFSLRIYYEDTDSGGVVYYANYLKFAERARTEYLRAFSLNQSELAENEKILFVVKKAELELKKPVRLDDLVTINTVITKLKGARIHFLQELNVENQIHSVINCEVVSVNNKLQVVRIPKFIIEKIS